jgi:pimeloyl-ACP methyl ester carboxylesterase
MAMYKWLAGLVILGCGVVGAAPAMFQVQVSGHGKPMLLIPGLASSGDVWKSTVARYGGEYECHVVTLAGFAGVPAVSGFSLAAVEQDLSAYMTQNKLDKPVIVGHSLGGFLALSLAAHHPEQVGRLIIVDSLPALGAAGNPAATPSDLQKMAEQMKAGMLAENEEQRTKSSRMAVEAMVTAPADVALVNSWGKASDWPTEVTAMSEMMGTDLRPEMKSIHAPTLVLGTWVAYAQYGGEAGILQTFKTEYEGLSGVKIEMAPKARHFLMDDDPNWMFAQMDAFLNAQKGS